MGYEQSEPVATCDGCGKALYEGDEAWSCSYDQDEEDKLCVMNITGELKDWGFHYCCVVPCLERAVVSELRQIHATRSAPQTCHSPSLVPPQDAQ